MTKLTAWQLGILRNYLASIAEEDRLLASVQDCFGPLGEPTTEYMAGRAERSKRLDEMTEAVNKEIRNVLAAFNQPTLNTRYFVVDGQGIEACFANMSVRRIEVET